MLLALGVAGLGSIFLPLRTWEVTASTRSRDEDEENVMNPNPRLRWILWWNFRETILDT